MNSVINTKPTDAYWNISRITEELLHHCEKHSITIWAEFGSLIGLKRHGGSVIPWDYDGDYGIFIDDKQRFIETFLSEKNPNTILNIDYYNDEGCLALHPVGNEEDIVDLIFYCVTETLVDSLQSDKTKTEYPSNNGYCYNKNDFFPLRKDLMLGHTVYYPNNWQAVLAINYDAWYEYPINFRNYIIPKFLDSPFKPIKKYHGIDKFSRLKNLVETNNEPFILCDTTLLTVTQEKYQEFINCQHRKIYGYKSSITWDQVENNAKDVWEKFLSNQLDFNIVDSPIDYKYILPAEWREYSWKKLTDNYDFAITWIMTNNPKITHFHIDPEYAGGFMKLLAGEKIWWCVSANDYQYLLKRGYTIASMAQLEMHELLKLENCYLFGKIYVSYLSDNDFIWFPINTLHKVITTKNSYGFGGYL